MSWPWILCALGLTLGALMGLVMLVRPRQSHLSIGLGSVPEKSGGVGESRAFGGLLFAIHAVPLHGLPQQSSAVLNVHDLAALLAIGWLCAFLGRLASVIVDREGLRLNFRLLTLDAAMTALIAAPLFLA